MKIGYWLPPALYYESVEEYIAAHRHMYWGDRQDADRVAHTTIAYAVADGWMKASVSTVFLMIDHGWGSTHVPVLWETMVFDMPIEYAEVPELDRYQSAADATFGHQQLVHEIETALNERNFPVLATVTSRCKWWTK